MNIIIEDGTGSGNRAKVDSNNRFHTQAVSETVNIDAIQKGRSYNISTGLISITGDASLVYLKNNEDNDYLLEAVAIGSFEGITYSDDPYIEIIANPTGGDIISDATAVSINQNRNFGSSRALAADVFKGKVGGTITGGTDAAILHVQGGSRFFYTVNLLIPKGSSMAVKLTANITSGSANYYCALIGFLKDPAGND